jgi:nucleotidyltransferase substrate binding protein (TIGR01987 family)
LECRSPRDCIKSAYKYGIILEEQIVLDMLDDRNNSTHIYSKEESTEIFERIKNDYLFELNKILNEIERRI